MYNKIKLAYPDNTEQQLFEEMMATMTEQRFVDLVSNSNGSFGEMITNFLKDIYAGFLRIFKTRSLIDFNDIQIQNLSIADFTNLLARDILDGRTVLTKAEYQSTVA